MMDKSTANDEERIFIDMQVVFSSNYVQYKLKDGLFSLPTPYVEERKDELIPEVYYLNTPPLNVFNLTHQVTDEAEPPTKKRKKKKKKKTELQSNISEYLQKQHESIKPLLLKVLESLCTTISTVTFAEPTIIEDNGVDFIPCAELATEPKTGMITKENDQ